MEPTPAPPPISPPSGQNSYDFIMNPASKPPKSLIPRGGSAKQRLLIVAAGGGLLLIIAVLGISVLFSGKNNADALLDAAQQQAEIIRIADLGFNDAETSATRSFAITTKLALQTSQNQTIERLQKLGVKAKDKELALKRNAQTDQTLKTAGLNNSFDKTLKEILQTSLKDYRTSVKKLYDSTTNTTEKQILADSYSGVGLLVE